MPTREETYLAGDHANEIAQLASFIKQHSMFGSKTRRRGRNLLIGAEQEQIELPDEIYRILLQVTEALSQGFGVSIVPVSQRLTTQQAADILGISRPTLVRLLDSGLLPYEQVGTHRKVMLRHVIEYREKKRAAQYEALAATSIAEDDEDVDAILESLRETRRHLAEQRRTQQ